MQSKTAGNWRWVCAGALYLSALLTASLAYGDDSLKVASFNIELGGTGGGQPLSRTAGVIQASGADVVGIQEGQGSIPQLAALLGWSYRVFSWDYGSEAGNVDTAILSRLPITQTLRSGLRVEVAPGKEAYVFTTHLTAYPYQPYDLRDHVISTEAQAVTSANNTRAGEINAVLAEAAPYIAAGGAVFLTGDMNEPSHLDWTAAAAAAHLHAIKVAWPASTSTVNAGFRDSYREIHPNEVTFPGNTWTPMPGTNEVHDRIDFVYSSGAGVTTINSQIVGESASKADIVSLPYPSDHRAVVSTFNATPEALARVRAGVNLISNGGAEGNPGTASLFDRVITDWESSSANTPATTQLYNKAPFAPAIAGGGSNYFHGWKFSGRPAPYLNRRPSSTIACTSPAADFSSNALSASPLPIDRPRGREHRLRGRWHRFAVNPGHEKQTCHRRTTESNHALSIFLQQLNNSRKFAVGIP